MPEFSDQVAVITGGTSGMGLATAKVLGRDHHVVISYRNPAAVGAALASAAKLGIRATAVACDITKRPDVDALFAAAARTGPVTSVVHTAGVSPRMGPADLMVKVNALGTIHVTEAALAVARDGFALVNVASVAGHMLPAVLVPRRTYALALTDPDRFARKLTAAASRGPTKLRPGLAYSLSKNFVIWYTRRQAAAFGAEGARILSVSPGVFDTAMGRLEADSGAGQLLGYAALSRPGTPEEIGELLAFCASAKPGYLTGTDILCDGGARAGITLKDMIAMALGA